MTSRCIVCESSEADSLYSGVLKCRACDYVYADLNLSQEEFESFYTAGYFKGDEYSDYLEDKAVHQLNFSKRLDVLNRYLDPDKHRSALEIGCAYGFFLELAAKQFDYVAGVDVTEEGVAHARDVLNLNAYQTDLLEWDFESRKFDVVCMWDTIEHLRAPDLYLNMISENMPSGGVLAVTTGDISSKMAQFRKNNWRLIHPPTHAHYFSRDSITKLLDRYGFDLLHFEHCGFYRSVDNIAYNLFALRSNLSWLYKMMKLFHVTGWNIYANLYDIMYVVARRR
ncbi:MAG: class I SAM-dependent methyltransferase [Desulfobulbaceae bacterium]|nr:class I SAM-dependent methyltransferase [Desulfobulbaceae bacterium]